MTELKKVRWLAVMAACVVAAAGCSSSPTKGGGDPADAPEPAVKVNTLSGDDLPGGYINALQHRGNDAIFTAIVRDLKPAKKFTAKNVPVEYVYTPVEVEVIAVLKRGSGSLRPGQLVTLRVAGGTTATDRTINEMSARPDLYRAGTTVQIFAQTPFVDPDTGKVQHVPNWSFGQSADHKSLANLNHPSETISVDAARVQANAQSAKAGWKK